MASSRTTEREEERRFNLRTLVIASSASATAAVVTSQLWIAGTWIAAAATPVLVAFVSELLHRPTEKIAERLTSDKPVLRPDPQAARAAARHRRGSAAAIAEPTPSPNPPPCACTAAARPPRAVARSPLGAVFGTGALALLIAVVVLTVPELLAGGTIGGGKGNTTFFSGDRDRSSSDPNKQQEPSDSADQSAPATQPETEPSSEEETATEPSTETETTPTTPAPAGETATTPAPAPEEQP